MSKSETEAGVFVFFANGDFIKLNVVNRHFKLFIYLFLRETHPSFCGSLGVLLLFRRYILDEQYVCHDN